MTDKKVQREDERETDRASNLQSIIMPEINDKLIGFKIKFFFSYVGDDGTTYPA